MKNYINFLLHNYLPVNVHQHTRLCAVLAPRTANARPDGASMYMCVFMRRRRGIVGAADASMATRLACARTPVASSATCDSVTEY